MPVGAAIGVAGLAGAGAQIYSANKASGAQTSAANNAAAISQQNTDKANALIQAAVPQANALYQPAIDSANALSSAALAKAGGYAQPYLDTGAAASGTLNKLLTPGSGMTDTLRNLPGYQFAQSQGLKGMDNRFSAIGGGGNRDRAGMEFATGLADQTYGNYVNQLQGAAGLGATSAANLGGQTINVGNQQGSNIMTGAGAQAGNIMGGAGAQGTNLMTAAGVQGNALIGAGNAQGAADMAMGNAVASGANSVANYYQQNALMNKYLSAKSGTPNMYGGANTTGIPGYY